jgi:subtilisin family serine protease
VEAPASGLGRGIRVAIIDSGVHAAHPHVGGVAGGTAFDDDGREYDDIVDRLGHGTAVAAVIREKAPEAELHCLKVFDRELASTGRALTEALRWAAARRVHLINLSLGTTTGDHEAALASAVAEARGSGACVVAAAPTPDARWLPGALPGVVGVELDWTCPRGECRVRVADDGTVRATASGYPRPIPGVPPGRNLQGLSFAVANVTALLARAGLAAID